MDSVIAIYTEKGFEPFKKPLLYASPVILGLYFMVYSTTTGKLANKKTELTNMESISEFFEAYENAKLSILSLQRRLPASKDKSDWLNHVLNSNAKEHAMNIDGLTAQKEVEISNYIVVSRSVSLTSTYVKVGKWVCDMENSPIFLKITDFNMKKDPVKRGHVKVNLTVSTVFSKVMMDN